MDTSKLQRARPTRHQNPSETAPAPIYHFDISHGRSVALRLEPGSRPTRLYRLSLWANTGMCAGGFGGTGKDLLEILMAVERIARQVDTEGLPGE